MRIMLLKCHSIDSVLESNKTTPNNIIVMLLKYNFIVNTMKYIRFGIDRLLLERIKNTQNKSGTSNNLQ